MKGKLLLAIVLLFVALCVADININFSGILNGACNGGTTLPCSDLTCANQADFCQSNCDCVNQTACKCSIGDCGLTVQQIHAFGEFSTTNPPGKANPVANIKITLTKSLSNPQDGFVLFYSFYWSGFETSLTENETLSFSDIHGDSFNLQIVNPSATSGFVTGEIVLTAAQKGSLYKWGTCVVSFANSDGTYSAVLDKTFVAGVEPAIPQSGPAPFNAASETLAEEICEENNCEPDATLNSNNLWECNVCPAGGGASCPTFTNIYTCHEEGTNIDYMNTCEGYFYDPTDVSNYNITFTQSGDTGCYSPFEPSYDITCTYCYNP